jgi:hypothetical protein
MEDGKKETAWVEGATDYGIGEQIRIKFEVTMDSKNVPFRAFQITNGYAKDLQSWKSNSRVKKSKLLLNGKPELLVDMIDSIYPQYVSLDRSLLVSPGDVVTLEILEVFKGEKYKDTAVSDLSLDGAH